MNIKNFNKWVRALESGEFEQARTTLVADLVTQDDLRYDVDAAMGYALDGGFPIGFCCLGVGMHVMDPDGEIDGDLAPREFIDWLGIPLDPSLDQSDISDGDVFDITAVAAGAAPLRR